MGSSKSDAAHYCTNNTVSSPLPLVTITGIGGKASLSPPPMPLGSYGKVTDWQCPGDVVGNGTCTQTATAVDGPIAPFVEDLALALLGPLEIDNIVVFMKSKNDGLLWNKMSSYSQAG